MVLIAAMCRQLGVAAAAAWQEGWLCLHKQTAQYAGRISAVSYLAAEIHKVLGHTHTEQLQHQLLSLRAQPRTCCLFASSAALTASSLACS
jgi:hypothetical protein